MKNKENFILLTILGTVALVGILLMITNTGNSISNNAGQAYSANSLNIEMTSEEEYIIYGRAVSLEYIDGETVALTIDGVLVKIPNGEKVTYDGLGMFSYGGEEIDKVNKISTANIDFYK